MAADSVTVSAQTLHETLADVVVLEVTWYSDKDGREQYKQSHIPGAQYVDVLSNAHTPLLPRNIPEAAPLQEQLRAAGVNEKSRVVVYDQAGQAGYFISSRAAWTLKLFGLKDVAVLDGGLQQWIAEGFPTTDEITTPEPGDIVCEYQPSLRTEYEQMQEKVKSGDVQILDSRPADVYAKGHVPKAVNIPFAAQLLNQEKTAMKSAEELKLLFTLAGVALDKPIVTMCNSGMSSTSLLLALRKCGAADTSVYHGGMTEWKARSPDLIDQE